MPEQVPLTSAALNTGLTQKRMTGPLKRVNHWRLLVFFSSTERKLYSATGLSTTGKGKADFNGTKKCDGHNTYRAEYVFDYNPRTVEGHFDFLHVYGKLYKTGSLLKYLFSTFTQNDWESRDVACTVKCKDSFTIPMVLPVVQFFASHLKITLLWKTQLKYSFV